MRKFALFVFCAAIAALIAAFSEQANAATVISAKDGNWELADTWGAGELPKAGDNVIIANKVTVTRTADAKFGYVCVLAKGALSVSDGATLKAIEMKNFGEINNEGTIEIGTCDGKDAGADAPTIRETVASGDWSNPKTWKDGTLPAKGEVVVLSHDVRVEQSVATIPSLLIVGNGATLSVGKDASIVAKQIQNYGMIYNEGEIHLEE